MACTLEQFIRATIESGLLEVGQMKSFMLGIPGAKRPTTAEQLAKELVQANKLTKYQAAAIYQGKQKGLMLGQYAVLDQIGAGAMGQVFKAQHRRMKRVVAIKVLPASALRSKESVDRFQREVQAAAKLLHHNIVAAYDADESEGVPFLVLEYVDGIDLKTLYQQGPISVNKSIDYIIQAARGLEFAHAQGVVHRDIKPANLLLDKHGTVKILDMGLARIHKEVSISEGLTRSGEIMGTVDYMSPEQAVNTHEADGRSDQYSLGCTLYRLLTGESVYSGDSMVAKIVAHRKEPVPSLCQARPDAPPELDAVFQKMVAKEPDDRYATLTEVIADLEACRGTGAGASSIKVSVRQTAGDPELKDFLANLGSAQGSFVADDPRFKIDTSDRAGSSSSVSPIAVAVDDTHPGGSSISRASGAKTKKNPLRQLSRRQWFLIAAAVGGLLLVLFTGYLGWRLLSGWLTPKTKPLAPVAAEPVNPNDLLQGLDLDHDAASGRMALKLEGKTLVATAQAKIQVPREIPPEYEQTLVVENTSLAPSSGLVVGIPSAGRQPTVTLDWHPNETDFHSGVASELPFKQQVFTVGKASTIVIRLYAGGLTVLRDGETILERKDDPAKFPENEIWRVPEKNSFFVGFVGGGWRVTKWEYKPINN